MRVLISKNQYYQEFISVKRLQFIFTWDLAIISSQCPLWRGVCKARVDCCRGLTEMGSECCVKLHYGQHSSQFLQVRGGGGGGFGHVDHRRGHQDHALIFLLYLT